MRIQVLWEEIFLCVMIYSLCRVVEKDLFASVCFFKKKGQRISASKMLMVADYVVST